MVAPKLAPFAFDPQLEWAAAIARTIANRRGLTGSYVDDMVAVAQVKVWELYTRFDARFCPAGGDPEGLFRGWSRVAVCRECIDEVWRIRACGLIRRRVRRPFRIERLGELGQALSHSPQRELDCADEGSEAVRADLDEAAASWLAKANGKLHQRAKARKLRARSA